MNKRLKTRTALAATLLAVAAVPAFAQGSMIGEATGYPFVEGAAGPNAADTPSAPMSRADVRDELRAAQRAGMMTPAGEVGDSPVVLASRESFNVAQAQQIVARYEAERQAQIAAANAAAQPQMALAPTDSSTPTDGSTVTPATSEAAPSTEASPAPSSEVPPADSLSPSEQLIKPDEQPSEPKAEVAPDASMIKQEEAPSPEENTGTLREPPTE